VRPADAADSSALATVTGFYGTAIGAAGGGRLDWSGADRAGGTGDGDGDDDEGDASGDGGKPAKPDGSGQPVSPLPSPSPETPVAPEEED
jgi:hypothetical protein